MERQNDALRIFDKALHLDPKNSEAWINRGEALTTIEKYDEAIKSFNTALKLEPDNIRGLSSKGLALERMKKPKKAKECYLAVINKNPKELEYYDRILKETYTQGQVHLGQKGGGSGG